MSCVPDFMIGANPLRGDLGSHFGCGEWRIGAALISIDICCLNKFRLLYLGNCLTSCTRQLFVEGITFTRFSVPEASGYKNLKNDQNCFYIVGNLLNVFLKAVAFAIILICIYSCCLRIFFVTLIVMKTVPFD